MNSLEQYRADFIDKIKNTMATNLTNKGQSSSGNEALQALADKIANVNTGKKWASGTVTSTSTFSTITYVDGTTVNSPLVTVSGLTFLPKVIILIANLGNGTSAFSFYNDQNYDIYPKLVTYVTGAFGSNVQLYARHIKGDVAPLSVTPTGFTLPISETSKTVNWLAFE